MKRRVWRKLNIAINRDTHEIIAQELSPGIQGDDIAVDNSLSQIKAKIDYISAGGAYDTDNVYASIAKHSKNKDITIAIPPISQAALSKDFDRNPTKRDHNILFVEEYGKYRWQQYSDYHYRSLVETAFSRYKKIIGEKMYSRNFASQKVEANIGCVVLNRMTALGMPISKKYKLAA